MLAHRSVKQLKKKTPEANASTQKRQTYKDTDEKRRLEQGSNKNIKEKRKRRRNTNTNYITSV